VARVLSQKLVENTKPDPTNRQEIPDGALVGLYLIVQPSGAKSWAVRYRANGMTRKLTLSPYPRMGLAEARKAAGEVLRIVSEGGDPAGDRVTVAKLKGLERPPAALQFEHVLERFLAAQERKGRRSTREMRRILEFDALPRWHGRSIAEITGADMADAIEAIVARGSPVAAGRFRAWCSKLFSYAVAAHLRPDNPSRVTQSPVSARDIQRDRKLSDHELALVWRCVEQLGYPFGPEITTRGRRAAGTAAVIHDRMWVIAPAPRFGRLAGAIGRALGSERSRSPPPPSGDTTRRSQVAQLDERARLARCSRR
jgi:Arm DNA-binding domain